jgi:hypothetical protein
VINQFALKITQVDSRENQLEAIHFTLPEGNEKYDLIICHKA